MTKKLNTTAIASELAGSGFFRSNEAPQEQQNGQQQPPAVRTPARRTASATASEPDSSKASTTDSTVDSARASRPASTDDSKQASEQASVTASSLARKHESQQADSLSSMLASSSDLADAIYCVVKRPGKEISYVRMTEREKTELGSVLAGIVQDYGYKVTETELARIAILALLADHAETGDDSLLMRAVVALKD
jgi:hypothetical protein